MKQQNISTLKVGYERPECRAHSVFYERYLLDSAGANWGDEPGLPSGSDNYDDEDSF